MKTSGAEATLERFKKYCSRAVPQEREHHWPGGRGVDVPKVSPMRGEPSFAKRVNRRPTVYKRGTRGCDPRFREDDVRSDTVIRISVRVSKEIYDLFKRKDKVPRNAVKDAKSVPQGKGGDRSSKR